MHLITERCSKASDIPLFTAFPLKLMLILLCQLYEKSEKQ